MNTLDVLGDVVGELVDEAIIEECDFDDALAAVARVLEANGLVPPQTATRATSRSPVPKLRQREIVDAYMEYSAERRRAPGDLARKRNELGASYNQMARWARRMYGGAPLARNEPRSALAHIISLLTEEPDGLRRPDFVARGVKRSSLPGAIAWGTKNGRLVCRKGSDGLYRYTLPDAPR